MSRADVALVPAEAPPTRFPDDIHDHETHGRLRFVIEGEVSPGRKRGPFTLRREDTYPVAFQGGAVRLETYGDGSFHVSTDDRWDLRGKWLSIRTETFLGLLEDARKVLRAGRIACLPEVTVAYTAGASTHYSKTGGCYDAAWEVSFTRQEVRHPGRDDRPTLVFETPESFARWAVDGDTHCGLWSAGIALSCAHAFTLKDAITDARERIALRAAGLRR